MAVGLRSAGLRRVQQCAQDNHGSVLQLPLATPRGDYETPFSFNSRRILHSPRARHTGRSQSPCDVAGVVAMEPFSMPPEWAEYHARGARTDSRTLPPAAFPSLPIDQPSQPAALERSSNTRDVVDLTESDEDDEPPSSRQLDRSDVISELRWNAINYHYDEHNSIHEPVGEDVLAERERLVRDGALPNARGPRERKRRTVVPRSVNCDHIQKKYEELMTRRKAVEKRLRELGYMDTQLGASPRVAQAMKPPPKPATIDALWRIVQDLERLTHKLKTIEDNARGVRKAKKRFFGKLPEPAPPEPKRVFRRGATDSCLPAVGWDNDPEWQAIQATAKKTQVAVEKPETGPAVALNWMRPHHTLRAAVPGGFPGRPALAVEQRSHNGVRGTLVEKVNSDNDDVARDSDVVVGDVRGTLETMDFDNNDVDRDANIFDCLNDDSMAAWNQNRLLHELQ
ncbi:hypothetical protein OPT61_g3132 [Boeremia exigua]|uniref:Uncharacterized protein n=1 Tax=Boeremia exigua TaxID=749465 RepID=A0ACC2IIX3_9PLEO|nr:hypothetical protein OPT61_g3132 [Boeremia exigua]